MFFLISFYLSFFWNFLLYLDKTYQRYQVTIRITGVPTITLGQSGTSHIQHTSELHAYNKLILVGGLSVLKIIHKLSISPWLIRESVWPLVRAPECKIFSGGSRSHWVLIRAPNCKKFVGWSGIQWALIRAPDDTKFLVQLGNQTALIRAPNDTKVISQLGSQWALIRAFHHMIFVGCLGSQWVLIRAPDGRKFVGRLWSQWAQIKTSNGKKFVHLNTKAKQI